MPTLLGLLAILFFSSGIACSRSLSVQVGIVAANATAMLFAGVLGYALEALRSRRIMLFKFSPRYLVVCGSLFVISQVAFYLAIGLCVTHEQAIVAGLINYLWCGLAVVASIPILSKKSRWPLIPGCITAFGGVVLATFGTNGWSGRQYGGVLIPYALAATGAIAWSLYCNFCRKWQDEADKSAVPLSLICAGLVLAGFQSVLKEQWRWNASVIPELAFMIVVPILLAYICWDVGMKKGNHSLILICSYFIPILSMVVSSIYLHVLPTMSVWIGAMLVLTGAVICKYSLIDEMKVDNTL